MNDTTPRPWFLSVQGDMVYILSRNGKGIFTSPIIVLRVRLPSGGEQRRRLIADLRLMVSAVNEKHVKEQQAVNKKHVKGKKAGY